ncbi:hypothetical protein [Streptomyces carminius]|nr:hypothetical protein [Streptomyces carminius]
MPQSETSGVGARAQLDPAEADPLSRWQRVGAAAAGLLLAGAGSVAMFTSGNGAGTAVALVAGSVFLLMAITGMPLLGGRLMDAELMMGRRRARLIRRARLGPPPEARRLLDDMLLTDPGVVEDPHAVALDFALLLSEVAYAADAALEPDRGLHPLADPEVGDPLLVLEASAGQRVGIYAMAAKMESGRLSASFVDRFTARAKDAECDVYLLVTAASFKDDLRSLAVRLERETGRPVGVVDWSIRNTGLRRGIDDLVHRGTRLPGQGAPQ